MVDKIRSINNPLTIIAIFAALAEVAGTVVLATIDSDVQKVFVWFVMGFPTGLVILFFSTLNFNPKVLYAPSDFRDEDNFVNILKGKKEVSEDLTYVEQKLDDIKNKITAKSEQKIVFNSENSFNDLIRSLNEISDTIEEVKEKNEALINNEIRVFKTNSKLQSDIIELLSKVDQPKSILWISRRVNEGGFRGTARALERLTERGVLKNLGSSHDDGLYMINPKPLDNNLE